MTERETRQSKVSAGLPHYHVFLLCSAQTTVLIVYFCVYMYFCFWSIWPETINSVNLQLFSFGTITVRIWKFYRKLNVYRDSCSSIHFVGSPVQFSFGFILGVRNRQLRSTRDCKDNVTASIFKVSVFFLRRAALIGHWFLKDFRFHDACESVGEQDRNFQL